MKDHIHPPELDEVFNLRSSKYFESYIKLANYRAIFLVEDFTKEMGAQLTALLMHYDHEDPDEEITIYLCSDGGDAAALGNIVDVMSMISCPVSIINMGKAYSAGAFLLASGTKGRRFGFQHSQVMIHSISALFPQFGEGNAVSSKNYLDFLNDVNAGMLKQFAKNTGQTIEKVQQDCKTDFYLTAKEALDYGIIDKVLG